MTTVWDGHGSTLYTCQMVGFLLQYARSDVAG